MNRKSDNRDMNMLNHRIMKRLSAMLIIRTVTNMLKKSWNRQKNRKNKD